MITTLPTFLAVETQDRRERLTRSWGRSPWGLLHGRTRPTTPVDCRADRPCPAVAG